MTGTLSFRNSGAIPEAPYPTPFVGYLILNIEDTRCKAGYPLKNGVEVIGV